MRNEYYKLITKNGIQDTLFLVETLSYSQKCKIINSLISKYDSSTINRALNTYEFEYIKRDRVKILLIENALKGICKRIVEEETKHVKVCTV